MRGGFKKSVMPKNKIILELLGSPREEREREKGGTEGMLEQIIAETFPNLGKETAFKSKK